MDPVHIRHENESRPKQDLHRATCSNLRPILDPPLSEYHFGNISRLAIAMPSVGVDGGSELLQKVREAISVGNV
ncbi:UNVERIFIED_CONTAM: hypothetical protein Sangu_1811600 [Sesamum angustifolium]|uniref:Uncharacterized protein n=1 Tax=Sesamum angustifolium TaxID=2727405 RepID=A0AAW2MA19_9LAMI